MLVSVPACAADRQAVLRKRCRRDPTGKTPAVFQKLMSSQVDKNKYLSDIKKL
jgi:hypothetical protein